MRQSLLALVSLLIACTPASETAPSAEQASRREQLGERLPNARLLWTRGGRIFYSTLKDFDPQPATVGNAEENTPRWSPDGSKITYARGADVWVMNGDFSDPRKVIPLAQWPAWADDGRAITAVVTDSYEVVSYDLSTGETTTIYDAREPPYNQQQIWRIAELHPDDRFLLLFRLEPSHATEVLDLDRKIYVSNDQMLAGDCQPAWAPDGSYVIATANTESRPLRKAVFDATVPELKPSTHLLGMATPYIYQHHGARFSADGKWITFFSEFFDGPETGNREIYLWEVGTTEEDIVRVTFNRANDDYPSLLLETP